MSASFCCSFRWILLVLLLPFSTQSAPMIGPELEADPESVGRKLFDQSGQKGAANKDYYLVAYWGTGDMTGQLISKEGKLLNPAGIALWPSNKIKSSPHVCSDGTDFSLFWHHAA